jgi:hypothetical protein
MAVGEPSAMRLQATSTGHGHRSYTLPSEAPESSLPVSAVALAAAVGVFIASAAYTVGRLGYAASPWADRAYWLGQALVVAPVAVRLLGRRRITANEAATLIVILTLAEYLLKICYSPTGFTFADELLHWRSTVNVLATGKLSTVNYGLPISPHYPGLEEATTALISVTGLPVFEAGLIIAGIAHLVFICLLYLIYGVIGRSYRAAGVAVLIYYSTPDLTSFNSMYVYETLALAFLGLAVFAAWRAATNKSIGERVNWFILASLSTMATVITHHVTSYALAATLALISLVSLLARSTRTAATIGALAVIAISGVACWIIFVAPDTLTYFRPTVQGFLQGINALESGTSSHAPSTSAEPFGNQVLEGVSILLVTLLLPVGWLQVWRHHRRDPWFLAMAVGSLGWFADLAIRVGISDGQEIAGRSATFIYIPVSFIVARALIRLVNMVLSRRARMTVVAVVTAGILMLLFDGLANGWPPYWERLPGPHQVAGFERSVGPEEIATADWTLSALGPGNRIAADSGIYPVLAGYGDQNPLQGTEYLYTSPTYTNLITKRARAQAVQYVLVDRRLSTSLPSSGTYFPGSPPSNSNHPIPLADLEKFNDLPGVARIYDSGDIVIYDLQGLTYGS